MPNFRITRHDLTLPPEWLQKRPVPGASPGTLTQNPTAEPTSLNLLRYGPNHLEERALIRLEELDETPNPPGTVLWLDVRGLKDHAVLEAIGARFGIHALALADVVNVPQRPKTELYDTHLLVIAHMAMMLAPNPDSARQMHDGDLHMEQVSFVLGRGWVVTFQESDEDGDVLEPVRDRIRRARGKIRASGADYLTYALLDAVVDGYYPVLDELGRRFDELEEDTFGKPSTGTGMRIHSSKRTLILLRRGIWHLRDATAALLRGEDVDDSQEPLMARPTLLYMRDVYDHVVQVVDMIDNYREVASSLMDVYLSTVNNRMNEVVKVLTIISTIFLPLSFIAGIYGMNFDTERSRWNMPELKWAYGYPFALALMTAIGVGMLLVFRHFGWIGKPPRMPRGEG